VNTLPLFLTSIGNEALAGCAGLGGALRIPSVVESICSNAFANCGFTRLFAPDTLQVDASGNWSLAIKPDTLQVDASGSWSIAIPHPPRTDSLAIGASRWIPVEKYATRLVVTDLMMYYANNERTHLVIDTGLALTPATFSGCKFSRVTIRKGKVASIASQEFKHLSACLLENCSLTIEAGIEVIHGFAFFGCKNFGGTMQVNNQSAITIYASAVPDGVSKISTTARLEYIMRGT